jgi:hypothetical protein
MKAYLFAVFVALLVAAHYVSSAEEPSLWPIQQNLAGKKFVDLTHEFGSR